MDNELKDDGAEEGGDDENVGGETTIATSSQPLHWLMSRMSFIARHLIVHRPTSHQASLSHVSRLCTHAGWKLTQLKAHWTAPLMSILRFFAGAFESFPAAQAKHFSMHALSPIYRILDEGGDLGGGSDETHVGA